ncbi:MAG: MBL fold metallo-hydrolase, partial [Bacilli bacterium]
LMGDASTAVEKTLISQEEDIESDVLKIGHHGSKTSTSEEFLNAVNPKEAVISVGKNYYGHPHPDVISLLNRNNIKIRRTDLEGTITYRWM